MRRPFERGFTIIELMIVVMIIGILAAIAVPSYRQYVRKNAQSEAESNMLRLSMELERWRAKTLTYGGFTPSRGWSSKADTVYVPSGSTAANHNYAVRVKHVSSATTPVAVSLSVASPANSWVMVATPRAGSLVENNPMLAYTSQGVKCASKASNIMVAAGSVQNCGVGSEPW
ncbi:type IV pilin protein [Psychrobacter sp. Pi2-52]|uniref:type IV pilin protein n=1 Tax=Psychrobacter sp. Pi2-52 TaxID=2774133 RepID=UPI0023F932AB|nr:type IV pilin protein [Psychrobacter sp. Pi2-52]